jgi:TonB family protein
MRVLLLALSLSVALAAQTIRIPADEAAKHLVEAPKPKYPSLAETARIQGNVILQISVNESGNVSIRQLIKGHPMLVEAAEDAVKRYRYAPFEFDGKPTAVMTLVMVRFGNPANHDAEDAATIQFLQSYWSEMDPALSAFSRKDFPNAESHLQTTSNLLAANRVGNNYLQEQWQWTVTMGDLRKAEQKYPEAREYYSKALALHEVDKEAPENAAVLVSIGSVYAAEKQYDLAGEYISRSIGIYQKNFDKANSKNLAAQQVFGRAIALQSSALSRLALASQNSAAAIQACRTVVKFQNYLNGGERNSIVSACQPTLAGEPSKN